MGMMAVEKGLIGEKDLTKSLNISEFSEGKTLKDVMMEMGLLSKFQAEKLERILERQSNPESARLPIKPTKLKLGELAVERGMLSQAQVDEAIAEQKEFAGSGLSIPIGQILMSKGQLTTTDVGQLIERQGRRRLECHACKAAFNITGYDEDNFYRCMRCNDDLLPCEIESIDRAKLEKKLATIRAAKQPKPVAAVKMPAKPTPGAGPAKGAPAAKAAPGKPGPKKKDPFSDGEVDDDSDDDLGDLMILEL